MKLLVFVATAFTGCCSIVNSPGAQALPILVTRPTAHWPAQKSLPAPTLAAKLDYVLISRAPTKPFLFGLTLEQLLPETAVDTLTASSRVSSTSHVLPTLPSTPDVETARPYKGWKYPTLEAAKEAKFLQARKLRHQRKLAKLRSQGIPEAELPVFNPARQRPNVRRMQVRPGMSDEEKAGERLRARRESDTARRGPLRSEKRAKYNAYMAKLMRDSGIRKKAAGAHRYVGSEEPRSSSQAGEQQQPEPSPT